MRRTDSSRRGFVLIATLLVLVVTVMMLTAALALLPGSKVMSGAMEANEQAVAAAQAGIEYARTRLQEDPNWRGDGNGDVVDSFGTMWVRESQGNIVGILWSPTGDVSMFKIRFNFQNGTGGSVDEGLPDPPSDMRSRSIYVSHNNLSGSSTRPLYRASSSDLEVDRRSPIVGTVPKFGAVIYSEGFAGDGLRDVSPTNIHDYGGQHLVSTALIEAYLGRDVSRYGDSVLYGARDVNINVANKVLVESEDASTPPRARSLGNIAVTGGSDPLDMEDGEVYVKPVDGSFTVNGAESDEPEATQVDSSAQFLQLGWDEIDKAGGSDARLPAGTYVWRPGGELHYYAQDFDPSVGLPTTPPDAVYSSTGDLPASASGAVELSPLTLKMSFTQNVLVEPAGSATGLTITSEPGLMTALGRRPEAELDAPHPADPSPIITTQGPFRVEGRIRGDGSITAEGDITFQGESVLEAKNDNKVAVYSRGDINIEAIPPSVLPNITQILPTAPGPSASPGGGGIIDFLDGALPPFGSVAASDVAFGGVLYAQGSFNVDLGASSNFHLHGILVAFGGDSGAGELPGAREGSGFVNITAKNAQLLYDSSYVANLRDQNAPTKLDVVSWRRYD